MAVLPVIADVFRVAIDWVGGSGQTAENVIHIKAPGKTAAQVVTAIDSDTDANMFLSVASAATAPHCSVTPLDGSSATFSGVLANWNGTAAGDYTPALAAIITLETAKRGRSYRGRIYLPFTAENRCTNGEWSDLTNPPAQAAAWAEWSTDIAVGGFTHVVASYRHATAEAVVNYVSHIAFATQRRRQGRLNP